MFKASHRPDGRLTLLVYMQAGGGVSVSGRTVIIYSGVYAGGDTVTFSSCTISGNTAGDVRAHALKLSSHRPDGKIADMLAPATHACTTANALVNFTTEGTCHRYLSNFPSPQWETHALIVACRAVVSKSILAQ
jgi:hypothetical protein